MKGDHADCENCKRFLCLISGHCDCELEAAKETEDGVRLCPQCWDEAFEADELEKARERVRRL